MNLRFYQTESAFDYMVAMHHYLDKHGNPVALYSNKHAVLRISQLELRHSVMTKLRCALNDLT